MDLAKLRRVDLNTPRIALRIPALPMRGGAESGALATIDPGLASIMDAWAQLPDAMNAGILAMVKAASG